jgi:hypothetical protein
MTLYSYIFLILISYLKSSVKFESPFKFDKQDPNFEAPSTPILLFLINIYRHVRIKSMCSNSIELEIFSQFSKKRK